MQIAGPVDEVFDFMADVANETRWNPDVKTVRRLDSGPLAVGSEWEGTYRGMGAMRVRLDEYERPHRLVFSTTGVRMNLRVAFDYAAGAGGDTTAVTVAAGVEPQGIMRVLSPVVGPMMRSTFAKRPAQLSAGLANARRP